MTKKILNYRRNAADAEAAARRAVTEPERDAYARIAQTWHDMADAREEQFEEDVSEASAEIGSKSPDDGDDDQHA